MGCDEANKTFEGSKIMAKYTSENCQRIAEAASKLAACNASAIRSLWSL